MENIIYNELLYRGYSVDVGVVSTYAQSKEDSSRSKKYLEVDFVCNLADKRIYIQSALALPTEEKVKQEQNSLMNINDSFKKIIITILRFIVFSVLIKHLHRYPIIFQK